MLGIIPRGIYFDILADSWNWHNGRPVRWQYGVHWFGIKTDAAMTTPHSWQCKTDAWGLLNTNRRIRLTYQYYKRLENSFRGQIRQWGEIMSKLTVLRVLKLSKKTKFRFWHLLSGRHVSLNARKWFKSSKRARGRNYGYRDSVKSVYICKKSPFYVLAFFVW